MRGTATGRSQHGTSSCPSAKIESRRGRHRVAIATDTQIIVTKPTIQTLSEAKRDEAADVAITEPEDAEGILVSAVQPSEKNSTVKYSTTSDDELSLDDTTGPGATSPRIISKPTIEYRDAKVSEVDDVMTTGPNHSENVQVGAHGDPPTVGETIE